MPVHARRLAGVLSVSLILLGVGPKARAAWPLLTITCPLDRTIVAPSGDGAFVDLVPATTTGGRKPITVIDNPPSGSWFLLGDTAVLVSAASRDNQNVACTYTVSLTPPTVLNPPTSLTLGSVTNTSLTLTWLDNTASETGYQVERSSGGSAFALIATTAVNVTSYVATGLTANTSYSFRVRAVNATQQSAYSNTATGTTTGVTGATFYVALSTSTPPGNDANAGTITAPFRTIAKGLSVLTAGATLYLRGGTYTERIDSNSQTIPTGTTWGTAPIISAYPGETVILSGSYGSGINLAHSYIKYVIFNGLIIHGGGVSIQNSAHHVRFTGGEIRNALGQGVQGGSGGVTNVEFIGVKIHHNGNPTIISTNPGSGGIYDHGMYVAIQSLLVEDCEVYENTGYGIQVYSSGGNSSNTVIRKTRVHDNHGGGNVTLNNGDNIQFYSNLVYNGSNGVAASYSVTNVKIYNNTVYNHMAGAGIQTQSGSSGAAIKNNLVYQNGTPIANFGSTGTVTANNLSTNPLYVNAAAADFHLQAGSAAINAGVALPEVTMDFDGVPRGTPPEIGAYEYVP